MPDRIREAAWRKVLRPAGSWMGVAGLALLGLGFVYAHWVEPAWIEVVTVPVMIPGLARAFDGYRLVQVSDIHANGWMDLSRMQRWVKQVNRLEPDLIALTGDFLDKQPQTVANNLETALVGLTARDGVYAVLGNHDHWAGAEAVRGILRAAGVKELANQAQIVRRNSDSLAIAGVDDPSEEQDQIEAVISMLPEKLPTVLMAHEPDFAPRYAGTGRFALQLSGHSHGGQVRLPLVGSLGAPVYARRYPAGMYDVSGMKVYTSRGVGALPFPFRFNCRPEITLFLLQSE